MPHVTAATVAGCWRGRGETRRCLARRRRRSAPARRGVVRRRWCPPRRGARRTDAAADGPRADRRRGLRWATRPTTSTPGRTSPGSAPDGLIPRHGPIGLEHPARVSRDLACEPPRLDRRAVRCPRHRDRGGRGAGPRPRESRRRQRGPQGGADHDVPPRLRRRQPATPTSRRSSGWPPRPRPWPRTGTTRPVRRTPTTSRTRFPTTAWWTTPATSTSERPRTEPAMKAVVVREPGGPEALEYADVPDPEIGPDDVLVDVTATAVNRADLLQRQGLYPPPPGASDVIGLECSGTVAAVGAVGDRPPGRRPGVRPAGGRWLRHPGRRPGRPGDAGARRGRPGDRGGAARGRGDGLVQRDDGGRAAVGRRLPGPRRRRRDRHVRHPAGHGRRRAGPDDRPARPRSSRSAPSSGPT